MAPPVDHYNEPDMNTLLAVCLATVLTVPAFAQKSGSPFAGRWDITLTSPTRTWGQWMEVVEKEGKLGGRVQPAGGAVRDMVEAKVDGSKLIVTTTTRPVTTVWELTGSGDKLTGTQKAGDNVTAQIAAVRAPALKRPMPKAWSAPEPLFNGKDLTGWEVVGNPANSHWLAREGELVNDNPGRGGANIKTTRKFDDFKLHIEVNCPDHGNSGIYLRGRYEIQIGTEGGSQPTHEMGAIYGYYPAGGNVPLNLGQWSVFDITLVGRYVTVIRDGVKIHDNVEIPGVTGGVLDSNEGEPGPFYIQGDHQGVIRYRNLAVSLPK